FSVLWFFGASAPRIPIDRYWAMPWLGGKLISCCCDHPNGVVSLILSVTLMLVVALTLHDF
ncbi:MAG: hypothetical protein MI867_19695, partial [Pseudomonadales bacterium]|nr:hypothetical protein [Pseudomonadales bacterium]